MSSSASDVVSTTTGMERRRSSALTSASTSRPSMRGRLRSSRIRPGLGALACSPSPRRNWSASTPSRTMCSELRILWCSKASCVINASPGSSSTSRTSITLSESLIRCPGFLDDGQGELEGGAGVLAGVQPDGATVVLDDLATHRETDTRTGIRVLVVQPLEDHEDPLGVLGVDPDAV